MFNFRLGIGGYKQDCPSSLEAVGSLARSRSRRSLPFGLASDDSILHALTFGLDTCLLRGEAGEA